LRKLRKQKEEEGTGFSAETKRTRRRVEEFKRLQFTPEVTIKKKKSEVKGD